MRREVRARQGEKNEEMVRRFRSCGSHRSADAQSGGRNHPFYTVEGGRTDAAAEGLGRHDRRAAAQRKDHRAALSRLYPQSRSGAKTVGAVGLSALEYLAAAAPERTCDP